MTCTASNRAIGDMQNAANRFGTQMFGDYVAIAADCVVGPNTWDAAMSALYDIAPPTTDQVDQPTQNTANDLYAGVNSYSDLTSNASAIAALINSASDQLGFGPAPTPPAQQPPRRAAPAANKPIGPLQDKTDTATSFLGLGLPDWVFYIGGGVLVIGLTTLVASRFKHRPAARRQSRIAAH